MTPLELIHKQLTSHTVGQHPLSLQIANKIWDEVREIYLKHQYQDLDKTINDACKRIHTDTAVIDFISHGGTSDQFAHKLEINIQTARNILNNSQYAIADRRKRPYWWMLRKQQS